LKTDSHVSFDNRRWKWAIVSLFIFLRLHFKGVKLIPAFISLIVRNWASWSDRSLIMGAVHYL
jgi:hypothetical protein